MYTKGDKVYWNRKKKKVIVNFYGEESNGHVIIQYKIKGVVKTKSVIKSSIEPIEPPASPSKSGESKTDVVSSEGWSSALQFKKKESGRPRLNRIWNQKCDIIFSNFLTKEVRGNGLCMIWSINQVSGHSITVEQLMEWAIQKDSSGESGYTIDPRTNEVKRMSFVDELNPPLDNLSEAWWPVFAKHLNCRFIILGCRMQTQSGKTSHTYTIEEYSTEGYKNTYFLYNSTHYWPLKSLIPVTESQVQKIKSIWENKTYYSL
jgi:hypothetical protein